jgi:hypothetical protein
MKMVNILKMLAVFFKNFHEIISSLIFRQYSKKAYQVAIQALL